MTPNSSLLFHASTHFHATKTISKTLPYSLTESEVDYFPPHHSAQIEFNADSSPNLFHLSLLQNDACPNFFNGGTLQQYRDYRLYVISRFPKLKLLDSTAVTEEERTSAISIYGEVPPPSSNCDPEIDGRGRKKVKAKRTGAKKQPKKTQQPKETRNINEPVWIF